MITLSRRGFIVGSAAAAGSFSLGFSVAGAQSDTAAADEVNAWIVIQPDETVVLRMAKSEMGQGSLTGLAQLVAEELECDWSRIRTEYALPARNIARGNAWGDLSTGGSGSIRETHQELRQAGATARLMLVAAAAKSWGVDPGLCTVSRGEIRASDRTTTYGKVARLAAAMPVPNDVRLKEPSEWRLIGTSVRRIDTADKLTGKQIFGVDFTLPGMLNAAVRACPTFGGRVESFDATAVAKMSGVRHVLQIDDATVAVVADSWWQAKTAIEALPIEWDPGPNRDLSSASIAAMIDAGLAREEGFAGHEIGDARSTLAHAARTVTATYSYPYQAHAAMEPLNATALYTPDRCEVWAPTQNTTASLEETASASGLPREQCEVYRLHLGGGFGRRLYTDFVRQAVLIAKQVPGTPIKLIWSREEDMTHDAYHPITKSRLTAALDAQGHLTALHMRIAGQSIRARWAPHRLVNGGTGDPHVFHGLTEETFGYSIPNLLIDHVICQPAVTPGSWRGVHLNQNTIYVECFLDEVAHAAGKDPLVFRQELLREHPKHLAVLTAAAERAGWSTRPPPGVHRGLAVAMGYGSYIAAVAEVSVADGRLKIHRVVAAIDPGYVVNPELVRRQTEGCLAFGLSACLYGECTVANGAIEQTNYHDYEVMRLADMPLAETVIVPSGGFWGGAGEPVISVAAPAVLNAIFAATGQRIRDLPVKNHSFQAI
ncbi:molybdopterin cofactor-binding domain-containing protein [Inquilinus sp. CA228]|uniref:xanthine dehydrogenase family protein molybdopterin-binding subunit n=1 Tax=Inquilinus sp. CA228 TaxID=3455609 RepID=UPI003F8CF352